MRPIILNAVDVKKPWGSEVWLNSTRPEAPAKVGGGSTHADLLGGRPALLGEWSRRLYGDDQPIFTKLIQTDFPPLVHVGFRKPVERTELLGWLGREQAFLRQILGALQIASRAAFDDFAVRYSLWATTQAGARWRVDDSVAIADSLVRFARRCSGARLVEWMNALRQNRAQLVDALNEIDLRREEGNLLLTSAGVVHAICGLSHQTHPLDRTRPALESLLRRLRRLAAAGVSDEELRALADAEDLAGLRARNHAAPKNEAWLPVTLDGRLALVEPQQTSDTTYALADFYTPFVWDERVRFRKGHPAHGLCSGELAGFLDGIDTSPTSIDQIRRAPVPVGTSYPAAHLHRLVDEPSHWPFFTAYALELDGRTDAPARFRGDHPSGAFQQVVVLRGEVELGDSRGFKAALGPRASAFIPATLDGGYELASRGAASLLLCSVPTARAAAPHL
jgi:hypothetical protein